MNVRFYLEPNGEPHIAKHGVDEEEVIDVLEAPGEDQPGREGTRVALGQTAAGRYLRVVYVRESATDIFVITAVELKGKPLMAYRRRRRRKGKS